MTITLTRGLISKPIAGTPAPKPVSRPSREANAQLSSSVSAELARRGSDAQPDRIRDSRAARSAARDIAERIVTGQGRSTHGKMSGSKNASYVA